MECGLEVKFLIKSEVIEAGNAKFWTVDEFP